jgi:hypothetical protein
MRIPFMYFNIFVLAPSSEDAQIQPSLSAV